jgi:nucleotide-binding universal stress UspA family protein
VEAERRIVVGVDGSDCSETALRWAVDKAAQDGATLVAVTTWTALPPPIAYPYAGFPDHDPSDPREAALRALNEIPERYYRASRTCRLSSSPYRATPRRSSSSSPKVLTSLS